MCSASRYQEKIFFFFALLHFGVLLFPNLSYTQDNQGTVKKKKKSSLHSSALGGSLGAVADLCAYGPPGTSLPGGRAAVQTFPSPPHSAGGVAGLVGQRRS